MLVVFIWGGGVPRQRLVALAVGVPGPAVEANKHAMANDQHKPKNNQPTNQQTKS